MGKQLLSVYKANLFGSNLTGYYAPIVTKSNRLKLGLGINFLNLDNKYLLSWTETGSGTKSDLIYANKQYRKGGVHIVIQDDINLSSRILISTDVAYSYFKDLKSLSFSLKLGYKF